MDQHSPADVVAAILQGRHKRPGVRGYFSPANNLHVETCQRKPRVNGRDLSGLFLLILLTVIMSFSKIKKKNLQSPNSDYNFTDEQVHATL